MPRPRGIFQFPCVASLLIWSCCCALSAQTTNQRIRNIVLVHGAWADGSGWKGVYDILVKDGYRVSIVQEPETSFQEDVAAVKRAWTLHSSRTQLRRIRSHRSRDGSIGGRLGVYRLSHAGCRGERGR